MLKKKFNTKTIVFLLLLATCVFLRFYEIENRNPFGWDQVNNAWAAKKIVVDHQLPLLGFQAKLNTGIYIGPFYYYLLSPFYFFTNLDPVASGIFAGVTSVFTFLVIFYVIKKLISFNAALVAAFINTVSFTGIMFDRGQGPVNFLPAISLLIFYALYKVMTGKEKYVLLLALALGFSFHVHLTAIFFPLMILFSLPFFPRTKEMAKYGLMAFPIVVFFLIPSVMAFLQSSQHLVHAVSYGQTFYHGFHLRRVIQLTNDAFIQFEPYFTFSFLKPLKFVLIPLFIFVYFFEPKTREKLVLMYLVLLWFLIPWFVLSTYSGEISDYYFSVNRFIVLLIIAFLLAKILEAKNWVPKIIFLCLLIYFAGFNLTKFFSSNNIGLAERRQTVLQAIHEGRKIGFYEGAPESYLYYYYMKQKGKEVY